jgi:hypothetical protein
LDSKANSNLEPIIRLIEHSFPYLF